jgi:endonuclease-8
MARLSPERLHSEEPNGGRACLLLDCGALVIHCHVMQYGSWQVGERGLSPRIVARIGNIYKSEGLFLAALDPRRQARTVSRLELERVWEHLVPLLQAGIEHTGRTTTLPAELITPGEYNWVYRRRRRSCFRCDGTVTMVRQGELARATYFCPGCQG